MRLTPIYNQILSNTAGVFTSIEYSARIEDIAANLKEYALPVCFLIQPDANGQLRDSIEHNQGVVWTIPTIVMCNAPIFGGVEQLADVDDQLLPALHGFQIDSTYDTIKYLRGELIEQNTSFVQYIHFFEVEQPTLLRCDP